MKVALVYDRVNKFGGAERVLMVLHEMFPEAPLYTSVYNPETAAWAKIFTKIYTSFIQSIPFAKDNHENFPFLMPIAFELFNFDKYDLVISVTSEAAKGIITKPSTKHICYCLTPTRYLWSHRNDYFKGLLFKVITKPIVSYLKVWDKIAAKRPDKVIAISSAVQKRIKDYYDLESEVLFPPVDIDRFKNLDPRIKKKTRKDYYLIVTRLVPYKKVDLAVEVFNDLGLQLIIVGTGRDTTRLKSMAKPNIKFIGFATDNEVVTLMQNAKAFVYPQEEDFGITAVEAQAAGCPVVAYKSGGVIDSVIDGKTGVFFNEQSKESLEKAIKTIEESNFNKESLINNAERFSKERFKREFFNFLDKN